VEKHEFGDYWMLILKERQVTRIMIDAAFTIQMMDIDTGTEIRIGVPFVVHSGGTKYHCYPAQPDTLLPVLGIFLKEIERIKIYKSGVLELMIAPDIEVIVPPDDKYEAWDITSSTWPGVTVMPGGSVAFWEPQTPGVPATESVSG
jgi:hypothetical protein